MSHRIKKVAHLIKEEISLIFLHKLQDPDFGLLTITKVTVSPDLKLARIYVSIFDKEKRDDVLIKLNKINGLIRSQLGGRIKLRYVPELTFFIDDTLDYVEKMEGLFKEIRKDDIEKED